ncbi:hypothetical protein C8Q80DRAFT_221053 [Daedaleopsis nitida]|nr:hypothetical protein C8Q80DRAFT_221053 [Daedaleopsis nitida]
MKPAKPAWIAGPLPVALAGRVKIELNTITFKSFEVDRRRDKQHLSVQSNLGCTAVNKSLTSTTVAANCQRTHPLHCRLRDGSNMSPHMETAAIPTATAGPQSPTTPLPVVRRLRIAMLPRPPHSIVGCK